ncbi:MAG: hypothetical protein RL685_6147 [Pseudomonadota bacterium]|jgi:hypothetical protein
MKAIARTLRGAVLAVAALSTAIACSDSSDSLSYDSGELADDQNEEIGELSEALTSSLVCAEVNANKFYTSVISPAFTSPATYAAGRAAGGTTCDKAYFVRVSDYRTGNTDKANIFAYAGAQPNTASACQSTQLAVFAFQRSGPRESVRTFIGSKVARGVPEFDLNGAYITCNLPRFSPEGECVRGPAPLALPTAAVIQFAVQAQAQDGSMQPIRMSSRTKLTGCANP